MDLTSDNYKKYNYPDDGNCKLKKSEIQIKDIEIFEYINIPSYFILGLINSIKSLE